MGCEIVASPKIDRGGFPVEMAGTKLITCSPYSRKILQKIFRFRLLTSKLVFTGTYSAFDDISFYFLLFHRLFWPKPLHISSKLCSFKSLMNEMRNQFFSYSGGIEMWVSSGSRSFGELGIVGGNSHLPLGYTYILLGIGYTIISLLFSSGRRFFCKLLGFSD